MWNWTCGRALLRALFDSALLRALFGSALLRALFESASEQQQEAEHIRHKFRNFASAAPVVALRTIKPRRIRWAGNLTRVGGMRGACV